MLLYKFWVASMEKIKEYFVPQILFNTKERRFFVEVSIFLITREVLQCRGVKNLKYLAHELFLTTDLKAFWE